MTADLGGGWVASFTYAEHGGRLEVHFQGQVVVGRDHRHEPADVRQLVEWAVNAVAWLAESWRPL